MPDSSASLFNVGGLLLPRPFRVRRLGHVGINATDMARSLEFYVRLLGLHVSDELDFDRIVPAEQRRDVAGSAVGRFLRHGTEHHSFVIFPKAAFRNFQAFLHSPGVAFPDVATNQITWQVGSLREVVEGERWFRERGIYIQRSGRDTPGSNWNVYPMDPAGHINELFYGMEQIGWNGLSKPMALHSIFYSQPPPLPHRSEYAEVNAAREAGIDFELGTRQVEGEAEQYDVGGVLLARPFKITRIGPLRLFVADVGAALPFYRDVMGLELTEEVVWQGHRCLFLRANTEHHSLALYPEALRATLGLKPHCTLFSMGFQLGEYAQLRAALPYLRARGVSIRQLPQELCPGMDYNAFAIDPDGYAIQLYDYMEQLGWDGKPRPAARRRHIDPEPWPETLEADSDSYLGEAYLGPWG